MRPFAHGQATFGAGTAGKYSDETAIAFGPYHVRPRTVRLFFLSTAWLLRRLFKMFASVRAVLLSLLLCSRARATVFFANNTTPANLTNACTNALLTDVQCSPVVPQFQNGYYYPPSLLGRACTSTCSTALQSYEQAVATACNGQTWMGYDEETDLPLVVIPNLMRYHYDLICLQDSGRWCNEVAAAAALSVDPGGRHSLLPNCPCKKLTRLQ